MIGAAWFLLGLVAGILFGGYAVTARVLEERARAKHPAGKDRA